MEEKLGQGEERDKAWICSEPNQSSQKRGEERLKTILRRTKEIHGHKVSKAPRISNRINKSTRATTPG